MIRICLCAILIMLISFLNVSSQTNVLLVLLDDLRYDDLGISGAPSYVSTPNFDRIGIEGAHFNSAFTVLSICEPSRATILSGLYPHMHGALNNNSCICIDSTNLIPYFAQKKGYTTSFIGKYHFNKNPQKNYSNWVSFGGNVKYLDPTINVNGLDTLLSGHVTDILTRYAIDFIEGNHDSNFFLILSHLAPKNPPVPQAAFSGMLDNMLDTLDLSDSLDLIGKPSFLNVNCEEISEANIRASKQKYYESIIGTDHTFGLILDTLEHYGVLDSTLIMVTSDNGFLYGEHLLAGKRLAYEESIRIPILMRYPNRIPFGTVVSNNIVLNLDIAPTILDAIGTSSSKMQGVSLFEFVDGNKQRNAFLYEYERDTSSGSKEAIPSFRSVRTHHYKLITYNCDTPTYELYDIQNDAREVLNIAYQPGFQQVRTNLLLKTG